MKKYYVGDLCYVLQDNDWEDVCVMSEDEAVADIVLPSGKRVAIVTTWYGDGEYPDQFGNTYSVDSGTIGVVAIDDLSYVDRFDFGAVVEFAEFPEAYRDGATIRIGHLEIETGEEIDDEIAPEDINECEEE